MNKFEAEGTIHKVLSKSDDVFIVILKTNEKYALQIKVKKFRDKGQSIEMFAGKCGQFVEGSTIRVEGKLNSEKVMSGANSPVLTSDGQQVYGPVIVAFKILRIDAAIDNEQSEPASQPSAQAATPAAPAPGPAAQPPAPVGAGQGTHLNGGADDYSELPSSPFQ